MYTWKNADISSFCQQFERNIYELNYNYPPHWIHFIQHIKIIRDNIKRIIDIGCGVGAYYKLCQRYFPALEYIGYDFSPVAIDLAKKVWEYDNFFIKDLNNIDQKDILTTDILVAKALCDIMPDGNECLKKLLSLQAQYIIIQRVRTTTRDSFNVPYTVYNNIETYEFYHNKDKIDSIIDQCNYLKRDVQHFSENIIDLLLERK